MDERQLPYQVDAPGTQSTGRRVQPKWMAEEAWPWKRRIIRESMVLRGQYGESPGPPWNCSESAGCQDRRIRSGALAAAECSSHQGWQAEKRKAMPKWPMRLPRPPELDNVDRHESVRSTITDKWYRRFRRGIGRVQRALTGRLTGRRHEGN